MDRDVNRDVERMAHVMESQTGMTVVKAQRYRRLLDSISTSDGIKGVLDIGCQSGDLCSELRKLGHDAHGVEIEPELISAAQKKYPSMDFRVADCSAAIPHPNGFFDVVWAGNVIEHITSTGSFLREINRVLKPGGHFLLTTPLHSLAKNLYIVLFRFEKHFNPEFSHYRFYTKGSLSRVLTKYGFEICAVDYVGRIPIIANCLWVDATKRAPLKG